MKSADVLAAMRKRYPELEGEWLFFTEAWRIDAFAVRCWSSGIGFRRVAIEVKVSRSDFLSEIRRPAKRQNALDVSHEFYFATPHGLVRPEEIPPECGLLYVKDGRARVAKKAPMREPRAFKLSEAIYLMRLPGFRHGTLELRRAVVNAQRHEENASQRMWEREEDFRRAEDRLVALAGDRVTVGSMWRGRWQPHSWLPATENVDVYVEEVHKNGHAVKLRCIDTGDVNSYVPLARVLMDYEQLDDFTSSVLTAAHSSRLNLSE